MAAQVGPVRGRPSSADTDAKAAVAAANRRIQSVADRLKIAADLEDRNTWFDLRESFRR